MRKVHSRYLWLGAGLMALSGGSARAGRPDATGRRQAYVSAPVHTLVVRPSFAHPSIVGRGAPAMRGGYSTFRRSTPSFGGGFSRPSSTPFFHPSYPSVQSRPLYHPSYPSVQSRPLYHPSYPSVQAIAPYHPIYRSVQSGLPYHPFFPSSQTGSSYRSGFQPAQVGSYGGFAHPEAGPTVIVSPHYYTPPAVVFHPTLPSHSFSVQRYGSGVRGVYGLARPLGEPAAGSTPAGAQFPAIAHYAPVERGPAFNGLVTVPPAGAGGARVGTGAPAPAGPARVGRPLPWHFHPPVVIGTGASVLPGSISVVPPSGVLNPPDETGNVLDVTNNIGAIRGGRGSLIVGNGQGTAGVPVVQRGDARPHFLNTHWNRRFFYPFYAPAFSTDPNPFFFIGAGTCPSLYFYYSGIPQYVESTQVIVEPSPPVVIDGGSQPPATDNTAPVPYDEAPPADASPGPPADGSNSSGGSGDDVDHYYLSPPPAPSALQDALQDIKEAWSTPDADLLFRHVRAGGKIHVSLRGKYVYSLTADDYRDMTKDAIENTSTVSFTWVATDRLSDTLVEAKAKHVFNDTDGHPRSVYATFTLEKLAGQWWIRDVGSSNRESDSNAEPAGKTPDNSDASPADAPASQAPADAPTPAADQPADASTAGTPTMGTDQ